jgi:hypothetical protein
VLENLIGEFLLEDVLTIKQYAFGLYGDIHSYINDPEGVLLARFVEVAIESLKSDA